MSTNASSPPPTSMPAEPPDGGIKRQQQPWLEPLILLGPAGIWWLLLLVVPALVIFWLSLVPKIRPGGYVLPVWELFNPSSLFNYAQAFEPLYLTVIGRSLFFAFGTTIVCLLLGFPVAYWIGVMSPPKWRNLLLLGFVLPLWTSSLLRSYAWITILRSSGVMNSLLTAFNPLLAALRLPEIPRLELLNDWPAVLIGMSYGYLPYMVLILYASLEKLDKRLLEASADLGANPVQTFWKVTVPQTRQGIAAGSLLVLISGLGDFVDPELLGGASSMTVSRLIYNQFLGATQNWGFGSALSMIFILAVSLAIALLIKFGDGKPQR